MNVGFDREFLKDMLKQGVCEVVFTKKDGSERTMNCTLNASSLPEKTITLKKKKTNPAVLPVYDMDEQSWKSFQVKSVRYITQLTAFEELLHA